MKGRKLLAGFLSAAMVLGTMSFPVFAENTDNSLIEVSNSDTLKAAVNDIAENGTIKFTNEITVTRDGGNDPGVITFTKNCTVDLNGQTLNTGDMLWFAGSAAVTFTSGADNGKIKFGDVSDSLFRPDENGSFSIENITFTQTENAKVCYLFNMSGENSSINLKNCVLDNINTASNGGVICGNNRENTKASIENCQITNINGVAVFGGQVTVKDSTISATTPFKIARDNHYAVLNGETTITGGNYYNNGNKIYTIGEDVTVDSRIPTTVPAATIGTTPYATLADAVAAAQDGDTITLLSDASIGQTIFRNSIDLNNHTLTLTATDSDVRDADVTFSNGNIVANNLSTSAQGIIRVRQGKTLTLDKVNFTCNNTNTTYMIDTENANLKICNGSVINVNNLSGVGIVFVHNGNTGTTVVEDSEITISNADTGFLAARSEGTLEIKNTNINMSNVADGLKATNSKIVVDNSVVTVDTCETGAKIYPNGSIAFTGTSTFNVENARNAGILLRDSASSTVASDNTAVVNADVVYENVTDEAITDNITVNLVPTDDESVYDIVLDGNYKAIYEFVSAELQFVNAGSGYEIDGTDDINVIANTKNSDRYGFYLKDGAVDNRKTATKIKIGTVTFPAQGTINFKVDANRSKVVATEYNTHDEKYYPAADANAKLTADENGINSTIAAKTRDVLVKVDYAHELDGRHWADNKITVTLKDAFGVTSDAKNISDGEEAFADVPVGRITVTLKAPGFRTYTYTTTVEEGTEPLVLSFWNDTKRDTAQSPKKAIEVGKAPIANNFVVGDIAMDYIVDKYDLAAVTSYYGTYNLTDENKIRCDLNRDGDIDITDVAYVLHNFGF